jgi:hypothetical protein
MVMTGAGYAAALPPPPDPQRTPRAFALWDRVVRARARLVDPGAVPIPRGFRIETLPNRFATQESSRNWSGAFARTRGFDSIVRVQGAWDVPDTPPPARGRAYSASIWVGMDGHDSASRLMPQIGTAQVAVRSPCFDLDLQLAWWQIWDGPASRQVEIPLVVARRDRIFAEVTAVDDAAVIFLIHNQTTGVLWTRTVALPAGARLERRTAAWIVERPIYVSEKGQQHHLPLAPYGTTTFRDCNAVSADAAGIGREFQLQRAGLIRMNLWDRDEARPGRLASDPSRRGSDALDMRYVP